MSSRVEFYTGHEGLLMDYERPMTRIDSRTHTPYNTSAHFLWIGERTRELDGAHVDYFSKIRNPIGVKLGPSTTAETLELIDKLDPEREPGRLTFITRMGAGKIRDALPPLLEAVKGMVPHRCGSPTPCTATASRPRPATRRVASTTSSTRCAASSRRTAPSGPSPAASTSSSPATT
jgi:3-deoxy-7-phosphoheptulonate synthase